MWGQVEGPQVGSSVRWLPSWQGTGSCILAGVLALSKGEYFLGEGDLELNCPSLVSAIIT